VVTGAWKYEGGGALLATSDSFQMDESVIQGPAGDGDGDAGARVLDMSLIGPVLCGDATALHGGPPVKAMLIQNTNPMLVAPDLGAVRRGFAREDLFVCVHEQFMTETAAAADVVLPATMFTEHDDLYRSYGHTFLQVGEQVTQAPGECRANHAVICDLAQRLGDGDNLPRHPRSLLSGGGDGDGDGNGAGASINGDFTGFNLTALQLVDETLTRSGYPPRSDFTRAHFTDCAPAFAAAHFIDGFGWPDKKFRFAPDWNAIGPYAAGMPALPDHWDVIDNPSDEHPLRLVAAPSRGYLNSTFVQSPSSRRREKHPQLQIHPTAARRFGVEDGGRTVLGNRLGSVTLVARFTADIQVDTVVVEGIWPACAFPENIGVNCLIDAAPVAPNGGAAFHDTAVWVKPAG